MGSGMYQQTIKRDKLKNTNEIDQLLSSQTDTDHCHIYFST